MSKLFFKSMNLPTSDAQLIAEDADDIKDTVLPFDISYITERTNGTFLKKCSGDWIMMGE